MRYNNLFESSFVVDMLRFKDKTYDIHCVF